VCGALFAQAVNLKPGQYGSCHLAGDADAGNAERLPPGYLQDCRHADAAPCITHTDLKQVGKMLSQERGNDPS